MKIFHFHILFPMATKEFLLINFAQNPIMAKSLLSLLFICITAGVFAQPSQQEKLEARKAQIQREILENQRLLQSVKSKEKTATSELILQKEKIKLKQNLISTTERQTRLLGDDMYKNQLQINRLNRELDDLRADYADMILKSYKSRSEQSRAMFLLSSENFLQAYKRAQYMKQYASYRKSQGEEIKVKSQELLGYNQKLQSLKSEKQKLLNENQKEKQELEKERKEQEKLVESIRKNKRQITAEIQKKQKESKAIDRQIEKIIRDIIAAENKKTAAAGAKAKPNSAKAKTGAAAAASVNKIVLTPEGKIVADNFRANKGKLPWPVEKGFVSLGYGDQPHPVHRSLIVHNSGVEITTEAGESARAVFGGEVSSVYRLSPVNLAVVIRHGDFLTVYTNLSSVSVEKGDKISIKEKIGKIRTNGETGKTVLKFVLMQNATYFNPQQWLAGM